MRRQKMAHRATWYLGDGKETMREALLLTYTDEQLRVIGSREKSRRGLLGLPEVIIDLWDKDEVDFSSENMEKLENITDMIMFMSGDYYKESRSSEYLDGLRSIAAAFERVKAKYGDPSKDGYHVAVDSLAEIACHIQRNLMGTSGNGESESPLSAAQEEGLVAAMFLLRQSGGDEFYPSLSVGDTSTHRWLTKKILASPDEVESHLAAFSDRLNRLREVFLKLTVKNSQMEDYDALCDYPDELIDLMAEFMFNQFHAWEDFCRYVLTDNERNSQQAVSEVLLFMKPFGDLNMRYLSGTIPRLLRAYECLPPMDDYSKATGVLREQCEALLLVSIIIGTEFHGEAKTSFINDDQTIRDQRLVDLLMARPELADTIARAVEERKIADFESLDQVSSGVLGNGAL
jgi:hypothetical protein